MADLSTLVHQEAESAEAFAAGVEHWLLTQAIACGAVREVVVKPHSNPNKLHKTMAPWFNEECRTAKKAYLACVRARGKAHCETSEAFRAYRATCHQARRSFCAQLPAMLKYKPKQFWNMVQ